MEPTNGSHPICVIAHRGMRHVTHTNGTCYKHMNVWGYTHEADMSHISTTWVMSHTWTSHVTHIYESRHTHESVCLTTSRAICPHTHQKGWLLQYGKESAHMTDSTEHATSPQNPPNRQTLIPRYKFKLNHNFNMKHREIWVSKYREIWVFRFGGFRGGSIFNGNCHNTGLFPIMLGSFP